MGYQDYEQTNAFDLNLRKGTDGNKKCVVQTSSHFFAIFF